MAYEYEKEKPWVFTDNGQRQLLRIRDRIHKIIPQAGCTTMGKAILGESGSSWEIMACVDRLVEIGDLFEIQQVNAPAGQNRIFTTR